MTPSDLLRRKLAGQRLQPNLGSSGVDRAFRSSWGRAARDGLKIQLDVEKLSVDRRSVAELVELVPDFALIAVLDGPAQGAGALILSQPVVAGFIEAQTVGRVRSQDLLPRRPTRTDGAMVSGVIDSALTILEKLLSADVDVGWVGGFRVGSFLDDPRPLPVVLEDVSLRVLTAEIKLSNGLRSGRIIFAVPAEGRFPVPFAQLFGSGDDGGAAFRAAMEDRVDGACVQLNAVLTRVLLPIADVLTMAAGMVLPLGDAALGGISLEGLDGRCVGLGKLGQNRGMRALRLTDLAPDLPRKIVRASRVIAAPSQPKLAMNAVDGVRKVPAGLAVVDSYVPPSGARLMDDIAQGSGLTPPPRKISEARELFDLRSTGTD